MNVKYIFIILLGFMLLTASCDEIEKPYLRDSDGNGDDPIEVGTRKVLLEEFTGHKCVNCPKAHQTIDELKEEFDDEVIAIAIHAGQFAVPDSDPDGLYTADYRTSVGTALNSAFQVQGYPTGLINRKEDASLFYSPSWKEEVRKIIGLEATAAIEIRPVYDEGNNTIGAEVDVVFSETPEGETNLCVFVTESGVISPQQNKYEEVGPTPVIMDYEHNHILRGSLNGTWGDPVASEGALSDKVYTLSYSGFELQQGWVAQNMAVIAFVYDQTTNEVLQVEKAQLE